MQIVEIKQKKDWKLFHKVPQIIYKNDPNWIATLEKEVEDVFTASENKAHKNGIARLWILKDAKNALIGRIAAFVDIQRNTDHPEQLKEGGIGFFECINDKAAAALLFKTAETFLGAQDIQVIDGPVNFGQRDKFWGLLVRGFEPPLYQENYNPPYYEQFFLEHGYTPFEQILTYVGDSNKIPFKRLSAIAERLKQRNPMYVRAFSYDEVDQYQCSIEVRPARAE